MKNKPSDILYCGCDLKKIKNANPKINPEMLDLYIKYQKERSNIYYKKEILKEKAPWTDWEALQKLSFTNTRRELDKESKILIENVLHNKKCSDLNKVLNACIVRSVWTKAHPLNSLKEKFIDFERLPEDKEYFEYLIKNIPDYISDRAYMISGTQSAFNREFKKLYGRDPYNAHESSISHFAANKEKLFKIFWNLKDPADLMSYDKDEMLGIGKFLKYQIWVDLTYISEYQFSENEFVLSGPGCDKGIHSLCEDLDGLTEEEFMFWLRDNIQNIRPDFNPEEMFHFLPEDQRNWGVMQIENSFCEFSKLLKVEKDLNNPSGKVRYYKQKEEENIETEVDDW